MVIYVDLIIMKENGYEYVDLCLGPRYGSNYETEGQLFYTGNTICNLFGVNNNLLWS